MTVRTGIMRVRWVGLPAIIVTAGTVASRLDQGTMVYGRMRRLPT